MSQVPQIGCCILRSGIIWNSPRKRHETRETSKKKTRVSSAVLDGSVRPTWGWCSSRFIFQVAWFWWNPAAVMVPTTKSCLTRRSTLSPSTWPKMKHYFLPHSPLSLSGILNWDFTGYQVWWPKCSQGLKEHESTLQMSEQHLSWSKHFKITAELQSPTRPHVL